MNATDGLEWVDGSSPGPGPEPGWGGEGNAPSLFHHTSAFSLPSLGLSQQGEGNTISQIFLAVGEAALHSPAHH